MSTAVAAETSTVFPIKHEPHELPDGRFVTAVTVVIHRPGDSWSYRVWFDDVANPQLAHGQGLLEWLAPGLFDAVIVPAMSDPTLLTRRQSW